MFPPRAFTQERLHFDDPPTWEGFATLLAGRIASGPAMIETDQRLEVIPLPLSAWSLLPVLVGVGVGVTLCPFVAVWRGDEFIGWGWWLGLVTLTWLMVLPLVLVAGAVAMQWVATQRTLLHLDTRSGELRVMPAGQVIGEGALAECTLLVRWCRRLGKWQCYLQLGGLVRNDDDSFDLVPLLTLVQPTTLDLELVNRITDQLDRPVVRFELTRQASEKLGDC